MKRYLSKQNDVDGMAAVIHAADRLVEQWDRTGQVEKCDVDYQELLAAVEAREKRTVLPSKENPISPRLAKAILVFLDTGNKAAWAKTLVEVGEAYRPEVVLPPFQKIYDNVQEQSKTALLTHLESRDTLLMAAVDEIMVEKNLTIADIRRIAEEA